MAQLHESGEDYLEAILMLERKNGIARSVDVARKLGVSKPSVSRAMGILHDDGYVTTSEIGALVLTESGRKKAEDVYERHVLLTDFLVRVTGVSKEQAEKNACRIEHDIDEDVKLGIQRWMAQNP